jgi:hypothetical protein
MSTLRTNDMSKAVQKRQAIEKAIAIAAIDQLLAAGFSLGVHDGEEVTIHHSTDKKKLVAALFTTDEDRIFVYMDKNTPGDPSDSRPDAWVYLVYGNDGYDVISDYTTNIEQHLTNAQAKADELESSIYG